MKKLCFLFTLSLLLTTNNASSKEDVKQTSTSFSISEIDSLNKEVDRLYLSAQYQELIGVLNDLNHHYQKENDQDKIFDIQIRLADINRAAQNFDFAMQIIDKLIEEVPWSDKETRSRVYLLKGATYFELDNMSLAISNAKTAMLIAGSINNFEIIASSYNVLGAAFRGINTDSSMYYINLAKNAFIQNKDTLNLSLAYYNIGNTLFFKQEYDSAIYYSNLALEIANAFEVPAYQILALNNLVASNKALKNYKKTLTLIGVRDSIEKVIISTKNAVKINQLMERIEEEQEAKETNLLLSVVENDKKTNKRKNLFLVIAIILVVILAFFSGIIYRKDLQIKKDLEEVEKLNSEVQEFSAKMSELNNSKDKILSIISHDLRSPFSQLITFLSFAEEGELSEKDMKIVNKEMLISSRNGLHILDNLLYWASSQKDGKKIDKREFLIAESINDIKIQTEYLAKNKKVKIKINCPLQLSINADKVLFEIVVRNLLSNAIKFSPIESEITIEVTQENNKVKVIVEDQGKGIPLDIVQAIESNNLEYRSTQGTKGEKGAGMGLYLSMEFAKQNGGLIHFDIQRKGTKAVFSLPSE